MKAITMVNGMLLAANNVKAPSTSVIRFANILATNGVVHGVN